MTKFSHHKYQYTPRYGRPAHQWSLIGPKGGVHFTAHFYKDGEEPSCGLEFHHTRAAGMYEDEAPHHTQCWLTGEPCWHDGTSLYASETLWPSIKFSMSQGDHEAVFRTLEHEYRDHFEREEGERV